MTDEEKQTFLPIFIDPCNMQKILMCHYFCITRKKQEGNIFSYSVQDVGSLESMLITSGTQETFDTIISNNAFWKDAINNFVQEAELFIQDGFVRMAEIGYETIAHLLVEKKDEIIQDNSLKKRISKMHKKFADSFYEEKDYKNALKYYEKEDDSNSLFTAAKIRLGYMKHELQDEQLKGFQLCEKFLQNDFDHENKASYVYILAKILYDMAQNSTDYKQVLSFIQRSKKYYAHMSVSFHCLKGKTYFRIGQYDKALHHFELAHKEIISMQNTRRSRDIGCEINFMLLNIAYVTNNYKKNFDELLLEYQKILSCVVDDTLLQGCIADTKAAIMYAHENYRDSLVGTDKIISGLNKAYNFYHLYLNHSLDINDYEQDKVNNSLKNVNKRISEIECIQREIRQSKRSQKK